MGQYFRIVDGSAIDHKFKYRHN